MINTVFVNDAMHTNLLKPQLNNNDYGLEHEQLGLYNSNYTTMIDIIYYPWMRRQSTNQHFYQIS